jgi:hypothetical protein
LPAALVRKFRDKEPSRLAPLLSTQMGYGGKMIQSNGTVSRPKVSGTIGLQCLTALVVGVFLSGVASGAVIIGDLAASNNGSASVSNTTGTAQGFTMTGNYANLSVSVELNNGAGGTLPGSGLGIGLYQDASRFPAGSALVTFPLAGTIATGDAT